MSQGMSVADAAYLTVHDYQGGAAALQVRLGKTNLSAEVSPNNPNAKLGLVDAVRVQAMTGDCRILYAMASELRHYPPMPMPAEADDGAQPCLQTLSETAKEFADLVAVIAAVAPDGEVTDNEMARVSKEHGELVVKLQALMRQLAAMNASLHKRQGV